MSDGDARRSRKNLQPALTAGLVALACFAGAGDALADTSEAERLFLEGRALMLEGRFDEACPRIAESQRLEPHVGTLLNLAACHERQGKVGSAWVEYQKGLTAARAEGQTDRARLAEQRIAAIEPRVPWLRLSLRSARADVVVTLDGGEVAPVALGTEMPVDPGPHVAAATVGGATVFEERVELREGEHRTVLVEPGDARSGGGENAPPAPKLVVEPTPTPKAPAERSRWILEPGIYVAYASGSADRPSPRNESTVVLDSTTTSERTSCAALSCDYGAASVPGTGSAGLNLFAGYAFTEAFRGGIRVLAGPMFAGGSVWAFGPSIAFRATSTLTLGVFGAFGDATISGYAEVAPPRGYRHASSGTTVPVRGQLAGGLGGGGEVALRLATLARGELLATATPFFLTSSQGSSFALPLGVAYRFE
ncbi:MAG: hypothetical protein KF764_06685 [Labilithrix sp.]|nr:hypothetical protein [Labilithrix sp.]